MRQQKSDSPNAVKLGVRIKEVMPSTLGTISGVIITLRDNRSPTDLLVFNIKAAEAEKKVV